MMLKARMTDLSPKRGCNAEKVWRFSWKLFQHAAAQEEMVEMLACLAWRRRTSLQIPNKKQLGPSPMHEMHPCVMGWNTSQCMTLAALQLC